jgi:hypothetical protein
LNLEEVIEWVVQIEHHSKPPEEIPPLENLPKINFGCQDPRAWGLGLGAWGLQFKPSGAEALKP